jgi:hypothetical protein
MMQQVPHGQDVNKPIEYDMKQEQFEICQAQPHGGLVSKNEVTNWDDLVKRDKTEKYWERRANSLEYDVKVGDKMDSFSSSFQPLLKDFKNVQ